MVGREGEVSWALAGLPVSFLNFPALSFLPWEYVDQGYFYLGAQVISSLSISFSFLFSFLGKKIWLVLSKAKDYDLIIRFSK